MRRFILPTMLLIISGTTASISAFGQNDASKLRPPNEPAKAADEYAAGVKALNGRDWKTAISDLEGVPASALTCYLLAVAYSHEQNYEKTQSLAVSALGMSPPLDGRYRDAAARLIGWSAGMREGAKKFPQFVMSNDQESKDTGLLDAEATGLHDPVAKAEYDRVLRVLDHHCHMSDCVTGRTDTYLTGQNNTQPNGVFEPPKSPIPVP